MVLTSVLWVSTALFAQDAPPDAALGKRLFESQCALCHGQNGTGGRGPSLNRPNLDKAPDDPALDKAISQGLGTEMPGAWQLSAREVASVRTYVRNLASIPSEPLRGNASRGATLYRSKGCNNCHIVKGDGGGFGPELTLIGTRRNASHLRESMLEPAAFLPEDFPTIELVTAEGKTIKGIRANEDTFTVQIKTPDGRFASYRKSSLRSYKKPKDQSLMPSYKGKMTDTELDDVVAYLAGLRGRP